MKSFNKLLNAEGDPFDHALLLLDQLFPFLPEYDSINIDLVISKSTLTKEDKILAYMRRHNIETLLLKLEYMERKAGNYHGQLSNKGREVKAAGGHFAYIKKRDEVNEFEKKRDEFDLKVKKWTYKNRYLPYIFSFFAILISILTFINNLAKNASTKEMEIRQSVLERRLDSIVNHLVTEKMQEGMALHLSRKRNGIDLHFLIDDLLNL